MMVDRVKSLREANVYNLHYSRHVVSNIEILSARDDTFEVAACYTVYQTDLEGQTRLFSVGQYRDVIANGDGRTQVPGEDRRVRYVQHSQPARDSAVRPGQASARVCEGGSRKRAL